MKMKFLDLSLLLILIVNQVINLQQVGQEYETEVEQLENQTEKLQQGIGDIADQVGGQGQYFFRGKEEDKRTFCEKQDDPQVQQENRLKAINDQRLSKSVEPPQSEIMPTPKILEKQEIPLKNSKNSKNLEKQISEAQNFGKSQGLLREEVQEAVSEAMSKDYQKEGGLLANIEQEIQNQLLVKNGIQIPEQSQKIIPKKCDKKGTNLLKNGIQGINGAKQQTRSQYYDNYKELEADDFSQFLDGSLPLEKKDINMSKFKPFSQYTFTDIKFKKHDECDVEETQQKKPENNQEIYDPNEAFKNYSEIIKNLYGQCLFKGALDQNHLLKLKVDAEGLPQLIRGQIPVKKQEKQNLFKLLIQQGKKGEFQDQCETLKILVEMENEENQHHEDLVQILLEEENEILSGNDKSILHQLLQKSQIGNIEDKYNLLKFLLKKGKFGEGISFKLVTLIVNNQILEQRGDFSLFLKLLMDQKDEQILEKENILLGQSKFLDLFIEKIQKNEKMKISEIIKFLRPEENQEKTRELHQDSSSIDTHTLVLDELVEVTKKLNGQMNLIQQKEMELQKLNESKRDDQCSLSGDQSDENSEQSITQEDKYYSNSTEDYRIIKLKVNKDGKIHKTAIKVVEKNKSGLLNQPKKELLKKLVIDHKKKKGLISKLNLSYDYPMSEDDEEICSKEDSDEEICGVEDQGDLDKCDLEDQPEENQRKQIQGDDFLEEIEDQKISKECMHLFGSRKIEDLSSSERKILSQCEQELKEKELEKIIDKKTKECEVVSQKIKNLNEEVQKGLKVQKDKKTNLSQYNGEIQEFEQQKLANQDSIDPFEEFTNQINRIEDPDLKQCPLQDATKKNEEINTKQCSVKKAQRLREDDDFKQCKLEDQEDELNNPKYKQCLLDERKFIEQHPDYKQCKLEQANYLKNHPDYKQCLLSEARFIENHPDYKQCDAAVGDFIKNNPDYKQCMTDEFEFWKNHPDFKQCMTDEFEFWKNHPDYKQCGSEEWEDLQNSPNFKQCEPQNLDDDVNLSYSSEESEFEKVSLSPLDENGNPKKSKDKSFPTVDDFMKKYLNSEEKESEEDVQQIPKNHNFQQICYEEITDAKSGKTTHQPIECPEVDDNKLVYLSPEKEESFEEESSEAENLELPPQEVKKSKKKGKKGKKCVMQVIDKLTKKKIEKEIDCPEKSKDKVTVNTNSQSIGLPMIGFYGSMFPFENSHQGDYVVKYSRDGPVQRLEEQKQYVCYQSVKNEKGDEEEVEIPCSWLDESSPEAQIRKFDKLTCYREAPIKGQEIAERTEIECEKLYKRGEMSSYSVVVDSKGNERIVDENTAKNINQGNGQISDQKINSNVNPLMGGLGQSLVGPSNSNFPKGLNNPMLNSLKRPQKRKLKSSPGEEVEIEYQTIDSSDLKNSSYTVEVDQQVIQLASSEEEITLEKKVELENLNKEEKPKKVMKIPTYDNIKTEVLVPQIIIQQCKKCQKEQKEDQSIQQIEKLVNQNAQEIQKIKKDMKEQTKITQLKKRKELEDQMDYNQRLIEQVKIENAVDGISEEVSEEEKIQQTVEKEQKMKKEEKKTQCVKKPEVKEIPKNDQKYIDKEPKGLIVENGDCDPFFDPDKKIESKPKEIIVHQSIDKSDEVKVELTYEESESEEIIDKDSVQKFEKIKSIKVKNEQCKSEEKNVEDAEIQNFPSEIPEKNILI